MEYSVVDLGSFGPAFWVNVTVIVLLLIIIMWARTSPKVVKEKPRFNEFRPISKSGEAIGYRYGHNAEKWLKVFRVTMTDGTIRWAVLHSDGWLEGPFTEEIIPDQEEAPGSDWEKQKWEELTWANRR